MPTYTRLKSKTDLLGKLQPDDFIRQQVELGKSKIEISHMLKCNPYAVQVRLRKMGYAYNPLTRRWECDSKE